MFSPEEMLDTISGHKFLCVDFFRYHLYSHMCVTRLLSLHGYKCGRKSFIMYQLTLRY